MENKLIVGRYKLLTHIGQGGFGDVYTATDTKFPGSSMVVKLEKRSSKDPGVLIYECKIMQVLQGIKGITKLFEFGTDQTSSMNYAVIENCGMALSDIQSVQAKLDIRSVIQVGLEMIRVLRKVHAMGILHRDLKPENFLYLPKGNKFFLIDFGLSKRYLDKLGRHLLRVGGKYFRGTLRYCSINMHLGIESSRRDDLESLAYVLVYLAKGTLPWAGQPGKDLQDKMERVRRMKSEIKPAVLCGNTDPSLFELLSYAKGLSFDQEPDYDMLEMNFKSAMLRLMIDENTCYFPPKAIQSAQNQPNVKLYSKKADSVMARGGAEISIRLRTRSPSPAMEKNVANAKATGPGYTIKKVKAENQELDLAAVLEAAKPIANLLTPAALTNMMVEAAMANPRPAPRLALNKPLPK